MNVLTSNELLRKIRKLANRRGLPLTIEAAKGSHHKVTLGGRLAIIPMHNADLKYGLFRGILKQLHITEEDLSK
jgi:predicted RNA binding protein YcfA (HicA-like mRNA interferase family)